MMKKFTVWVLCFCFLSSMTVHATEVSSGDITAGDIAIGDTTSGNIAAEDVVTDDAVADTAAGTFEVADVTGMNYADADAALADIPLEIIHKYAASDMVAEDVVISQSAVGTVAEGETTQLILTISQGAEEVEAQKMTENTARGISAVLSSNSNIVIDGEFSDWADKPYSWEYGYDNSSEVWGGWFFVDGKAEKCEEGTFNNIVRNKISLYCDNENVYVYVQLAKAYKAGFSGEDFEFTFDGKMAAFQLMAQEVDNKTPGIYTVNVKDRNTYALADGAVAKILVHEGGINNEMEVKIPLSAIKSHNPSIDIENIGTIQFKTSHLMYRPVTASGADTMPYLWAILALILVPVSVFAIRKYSSKHKEIVN